jgi:trans-aconitate 2-methyltransferase
MAPWDPAQYLKFQAERFLPFEDCLKMIAVRPRLRVVDLGCGTGELTRKLADALPESEVLGLDSSAAMLEKARAVARPGLAFRQERIEDAGGSWDLVFSHAAIHWVEDHPRLMPRLLGIVAPGGQLVVQLPNNFEHPSQREIATVAAEEPFRSHLPDGPRRPPVLPLAEYAELLWAHGGRELIVFEKVYPHVLPDADAVAEWTRGTTLVPLLERLPPELVEPFLARYRERLRARWPAGPVFFGFRRILFSVRRT